MNAQQYYHELTETDTPRLTATLNPAWQSILNKPLPGFHANIRHQNRKEQAQNVRKLFRDMRISDVSVTTPSYSMAQSIQISIPSDVPAHDSVHAAAEIESQKDADYKGMVHYCPFCKQRKETRDHIQAIVLAAFPDLNDRSDIQSDYFNYRLSIE